MSEPLYQLIYISKNAIPGDDGAVRREIKQILSSAQTKNAQANLTGALLFNAGCFAQILEGTHDDIQETFERIQCDPRHSHVTILTFQPLATRVFGQWSMGYVGQDSIAATQFRGIAQASGFDLTKVKGEQIVELLKAHLFETESLAMVT